MSAFNVKAAYLLLTATLCWLREVNTYPTSPHDTFLGKYLCNDSQLSLELTLTLYLAKGEVWSKIKTKR